MIYNQIKPLFRYYARRLLAGWQPLSFTYDGGPYKAKEHILSQISSQYVKRSTEIEKMLKDD